MGPIEGLDKAVAQLEKQAYDQSQGNKVGPMLHMLCPELSQCINLSSRMGLMDSGWENMD